MKKTLAAAITSALVIGAASTTFAAANPFSDVPTDHWSYDAVTKLAQDGVIDGYGDSQFKGDRTITRYEMAQMVAKAMTKADLNPQAKATLDKLAAEYGDELKNLGVRVAALEKKADNVKWSGLVRYTGEQERHDGVAGHSDTNQMMLRLDMDAKVNDKWSVKSRIDSYGNNTSGQELKNVDKLNLHATRTYAEGPLFGADTKIGRMGAWSANGLTMDAEMSGISFEFGKAVKTKIAAGRFNLVDNDSSNFAGAFKSGAGKESADYGTIQFDYAPSDKWDFNLGYEQLHNIALKSTTASNFGDKFGVWSAGMNYHFNSNLALNTEYAKNTKSKVNDYKKAYSVELAYKGADQNKPKSFGMFVAYRNLGGDAVFAPTYDAISANQKGYEFGGDYAFDKNIVGQIKYFKGKDIDTDRDASKIFGRVEFFF